MPLLAESASMTVGSVGTGCDVRHILSIERAPGGSMEDALICVLHGGRRLHRGQQKEAQPERLRLSVA